MNSISSSSNNPRYSQASFSTLRMIIKALRPHQWVKNVLVFLPLIMSHQVSNVELFLDAVLGFLAFSFLASGTYVINDLVDRENDRQHPTKKNRPFASGALSPGVGYVLSPVLIVSSFVLSISTLPILFSVVLTVYLIVTLTYSFIFKRWVALDVVVLGGLYALRVLAGAAATWVELSEWLLAFSLFFFLSLALLKRYAELRRMQKTETTTSKGRGYSVEDAAMLRGIGPATGFMAVLVLALYITSPVVTALYSHPIRLWLVTPLLLYWIMHMWLVAHRREMPYDPVLYTVRDPISWGVGGIAAAIILAASL